MERKKVKAIISRSNTGYVIMMEGFNLAMSYGDTLEEAKRDFEIFPQEYIEISKETGKAIPAELNDGNLEFEYAYDFSDFFSDTKSILKDINLEIQRGKLYETA